MINKKEIVYPVFLECLHYVENIFWENIFEDLAYSKPPYGTYFSKNFFCCNQKNKEFVYKIEKKSAEKIYKEVYDILKSKFGLLSEKDKISKKKKFIQFEDNLKKSRIKWADIRKKNLKDALIEVYVLKMKKKYQLTFAQAKYLLSVIFIAMIFKIITSKDIIYNDGRIEDIKGITFSKKKFIIKHEIHSLTKTNFNIDNQKLSMVENWDKYVKELHKKKLNTYMG